MDYAQQLDKHHFRCESLALGCAKFPSSRMWFSPGHKLWWWRLGALYRRPTETNISRIGLVDPSRRSDNPGNVLCRRSASGCRENSHNCFRSRYHR